MDNKAVRKSSSRLLGMKFMQKSLEKEVQEQLEKERKRVISEAEWVLDAKDTEIEKPKIHIEYEPSYLVFTPDSTVGRNLSKVSMNQQKKTTRILKMQKEKQENKRKRMLKKNMKIRLQKKCQLSGRFKRNQKRERDQKNQINQGSNLKQRVLSDPNNKKMCT
ncbi:unnamed protein product [Rhizopus stolonifer]